MSKRSRRVLLTDLPTEVLLEIFNFIPRKNLLNLRKVNKEFKAIVKLTKLALVYETFFYFFSKHREALTVSYDIDDNQPDDIKKKHEPILLRDYDSIEEIITHLTKLKNTLRAQELIEGYIWDLEKHEHVKRHPPPQEKKKKKKKKNWGYQPEEKLKDKISRKDVQPIEEREILNTKGKVKEFRDLCTKINVKSFDNIKNCSGKRCDYSSQIVVFSFDVIKNGRVLKDEILLKSEFHTQFDSVLSARMKFKDKDINKELDSKNLNEYQNDVTQGFPFVKKRKKKKTVRNCGSKIYDIVDGGGTYDYSLDNNNDGEGFNWEDFKERVKNKMEIFQCFKKVMKIRFLSDVDVARILCMLCFVFINDLVEDYGIWKRAWDY